MGAVQLPKGIKSEDVRLWKQAFGLWFTKASRIAVVMARGAYWLGERKRLLTQLGSQAFEQVKQGSLDAASLEPLAKQLQRLDEKLQAEEALIQDIKRGSHEG
jgi:hypothetical protein